MAQADLISDPMIAEFLAAKGSMVDSSKRAYTHTLYRFQEFCFLHDTIPRLANSGIIASFLDQFKDLMLKSRKSYMTVLRVFYSWMLEEEIITKDPMKAIGRPKGNARANDRKVMLSNDFQKLLSKCQGMKIRTIISFMYYTGVRSEELIELRMKDVNLSEDYIYVSFSKTSSGNRKIPIHSDLKKLLLVYLKKRYEFELDHNFLFFNKHGKKLAYRTLLGYVEMVQRNTDLNFACHDFRRAFVTRVYESTKDIIKCQRLAGHASIETTRRYVLHLQDIEIEGVVF